MILSDRFYLLIFRLIGRLFGLVLIGFSIVFTLALFSYSSLDTSFNTFSTEDNTYNWVGSFGAHISDLSFQLIGFSSFLLALIIFSIGTKMSRRRRLTFIVKNYLNAILFALLFSIFCCFASAAMVGT
jgi:DNA segregation ATPase FtsK/SpoIIIE-like protein